MVEEHSITRSGEWRGVVVLKMISVIEDKERSCGNVSGERKWKMRSKGSTCPSPGCHAGGKEDVTKGAHRSADKLGIRAVNVCINEEMIGESGTELMVFLCLQPHWGVRSLLSFSGWSNPWLCFYVDRKWALEWEEMKEELKLLISFWHE